MERRPKRGRSWIVAGVLILALGGALGVIFWPSGAALDPGPNAKEVWFADVTDQVGMDFVHDPGDLTKLWQPQIHGSGVALFDFDGDGRLDIYLLNFGGPGSKSINRLYKNMPDGTFKDVTEGSGLGFDGFNTGVAIGDVNNDGRPDVLVTQYCNVKLCLNKGDGAFQDVTVESDLKNPLWGTSASFVDYDRDGWLDLVIVNYLDDDPNWRCYNTMSKRDYCGPMHFSGTVSKLFRNLGGATSKDQGPNGKMGVHFQDVTLQAGLAKPGPGLGVFCADFTGDGWPDILIANDGKPNHLWVNQKNGAFLEEAYPRGIAVDSLGRAQAGMGIAIGDVDGDGLLDVYITHTIVERNTLWKQGPQKGQFRDLTTWSGLLATAWRGTGFGTLMADFDQDGWSDLAVANGAVSAGNTSPHSALGEHFQLYSEKNQIFRNQGGGIFHDVSRLNAPFCGTPNVARGLACGDLDGDGALDLVLTTAGNRARVFRNVAKERGHWLMVRALDPRLNRDAYGAEIRVQAGAKNWLRIVQPNDSYQSCSDPRPHFGLGNSARFDAIHILWPDGLAEAFPGDAADRLVVVRRGQGTAISQP